MAWERSAPWFGARCSTCPFSTHLTHVKWKKRKKTRSSWFHAASAAGIQLRLGCVSFLLPLRHVLRQGRVACLSGKLFPRGRQRPGGRWSCGARPALGPRPTLGPQDLCSRQQALCGRAPLRTAPPEPARWSRSLYSIVQARRSPGWCSSKCPAVISGDGLMGCVRGAQRLTPFPFGEWQL